MQTIDAVSGAARPLRGHPAPRTLYRKLVEQRAGGASDGPLFGPGLLLVEAPGAGRADAAETVEMRVRINGVLARADAVEDLVDHVAARFGGGDLQGHAIEFCGNAVVRLSPECRRRLCAAATIRGARAAVIAPDPGFVDAILALHPGLQEVARRRVDAHCRALRSDFGAPFERDLVVDARYARKAPRGKRWFP